MIEKQKFYFESEDSDTCYLLKYHINDARNEGKEEVILIEAIPDDNNPDVIFCGHYGELTDREFCSKSSCPSYSSKSGRGKCLNKGNLFQHGEPVTFKVV